MTWTPNRNGIPDGHVPVQAWGVWRGLGWYFRARHDAWSWRCPDHHLWLADGVTAPDRAWWAEGEWFNAGWMDHADAARLIARALTWAEATPAGGETDLTSPDDPRGEPGPLEDPRIRAEREAEFWAVVNSMPRYNPVTGETTPGVPLSPELEAKYSRRPEDDDP